MAMLVLSACASSVRAQGQGTSDGIGIATATIAVLPPTVGVLIPIIANGVYLTRGAPPPNGWSVGLGYVLGAFELAGSAAFLVLGVVDAGNDVGLGAATYGPSAVLLGLGLTSVLLARFADRIPIPVTVTPLVLMDEKRNPCPGLGLAIAHW